MTPPRTRAQRARRTIRRVLLGALLLFVGLGTLGAVLGPAPDAAGAPVPVGPAAAPPSLAAPATTAPATAAPTTAAATAAPTTAAPTTAAPTTVAPAPVTRAPATTTRAPVPTTAAPAVPDVPEPDPTTARDEPEPAVYYANCAAVQEAGAAPIRRGDPGYRSALDRDGDGQGCAGD